MGPPHLALSPNNPKRASWKQSAVLSSRHHQLFLDAECCIASTLLGKWGACRERGGPQEYPALGPITLRVGPSHSHL